MIRVILLGCLTLLAGCTSSFLAHKNAPLQLAHRDLIVADLQNVGTVNVRPFIDYRSMDERMDGSDEANLEQPAKIFSYQTEPSARHYLQSVLRMEANRTGVLTPSTEAKYQLTGIIYNMVVGQWQNEPKEYFSHVKFLAVLKQGDKRVFRRTYEQRETRPSTPELTASEQSRLLDVAVTKAVAQLYMDIEARMQPKKKAG